ncbi:hypothetical protein KC331_g10906 [Hortaea werneckii]|uniref:Uncharacterized protein n=1 Tax=Hortaea werneckii TaxID=91943 RepID=A0A3M7CJB3_HORWE|nr:hypothetical protein KC331_g10906 [Hortaea werneckii]KAI7709148.1 hypothetical protein KC353_g10580 [Hortaea werneckii]RMY51980.1 hypothetical protein D0865_06039 [Hortaea werneckii]
MIVTAALTALLGLAAAQAPNTLARYNPNMRTASYNATFGIISVPKSVAQDLVPDYDLLPVPQDDSLFPNGFPEDQHPILVTNGFQNDIRITVVLPLQIKALLSAQYSVPYVDRLGNGKDAFQYQLNNYIGGIDGQNTMSLVPALVGSATGTPAVPATFDPNDQAYNVYPTGEYSSLVKQIGVFNFLSGPSIQGEAFDIYSSNEPTEMYTHKAFRAMNNQPLILQGLVAKLCLRNNYYFNDTQFMEPALLSESVTFGSAVKSPLKNQVYKDQGAYAAVAQILGHNPESCSDAIANNDPAASQ